jgi:hypothetical protein
VVALGAYLFFAIGSRPETPPESRPGESLVQRARDAVQKQIAELKQESEPRQAPAQQQAQKAQKLERPAAQGRGSIVLEAGRTWRYSVKVEPAVWTDVTLTYRTVQEGGALGVRTDFRHSGGQSAFNLGTFARNHPSHSNTRFPGFFMYAAYLEHPLEPGQAVSFGWRWQGGPETAARTKRFDGRVLGWEELQLPGGKLPAAKIEGTLSYLEDNKVHGRARETFWYAPKVSQVVRIAREGKTPDEAVTRIVAELAEYR